MLKMVEPCQFLYYCPKEKVKNSIGFFSLWWLHNSIKPLSQSSYLQPSAYVQQKAIHQNRKALELIITHTATSQRAEQAL